MMNESRRVIVVAPRGTTRARIEAFLERRGVDVCSIRRESFLRDQDVLIDQQSVRVDGVDVSGADAAIVIDSGYMWPVPMLTPTKEEWELHRGRFDAYLRDERETQSFWYSLLDFINDRVAVTVNPQGSFALQATKPDAMAELAKRGVPLPPMILTNDRDRLEGFMARTAGRWLSLSLTKESSRLQNASELAGVVLEKDPVFLQSVDGESLLRLQSVEGRIVWSDGAEAVEEVAAWIAAVHEALGAPWLELELRPSGGRWTLSDFDPGPRLDRMQEGESAAVLEAVWRRLWGRP